MTTVHDLKLEETEWIRLDFVDIFGDGHALHLPARRLEHVVGEGIPFDGSALEGHARSLEADMLLVPDASTLRRISDDVARVVCTARTPDGRPWVCDPRVALANLLDRYDDLATSITFSAELEFYLLDRERRPIDQGGYYDGSESAGVRLVRAAAAALERCGIEVESCHVEAGPGQFEIDLAALAPLEFCDALILAKQIVHDSALDAGVVPSFAARPLNDAPGSGLHVHQRSRDLLAPGGALTPDGEHFVAGQLQHARALSALAAPTVNSYKRLHSGPEAPGAAVWARLNRGALVRVSSFGDGESSIEFRGADPLANPYLLVAGLLTAGADGVAGEAALPPASDEDALGGYDPAAVTVRFDPLPRDLDSALDAFVADDALLDAFDGQLVGRLVDGRRAEAAAHRSRVTPWELS